MHHVIESFLRHVLKKSLLFSSSMNEMTRKRKLCCGLSSCCGKTRSESAQMIAGKSLNQPMTRGQKCANCCCLPFRKVGNLFKRRKVESMDGISKESTMPSLWERLCCCSSCCRRCRKDDVESVKKVSSLLTAHELELDFHSNKTNLHRLESSCNMHNPATPTFVRMQSLKSDLNSD